MSLRKLILLLELSEYILRASHRNLFTYRDKVIVIRARVVILHAAAVGARIVERSLERRRVRLYAARSISLRDGPHYSLITDHGHVSCLIH